MKSRWLKISVALGLTVVAAVALLMVRNTQLDAGTSALKGEHGSVAIERLSPLAKLGDSEAQYLLGCIYANGWGGVSKNQENARHWFRRSGKSTSTETDAAAARAC